MACIVIWTNSLQEEIENKIEVADALAVKLFQRFNYSVSAMKTTSQHLSEGNSTFFSTNRTREFNCWTSEYYVNIGSAVHQIKCSVVTVTLVYMLHIFTSCNRKTN